MYLHQNSSLITVSSQNSEQARQEGQFDGLPGAGKLQQLDGANLVPEQLRAAYRLLKNAGYLPPELEARKEYLKLRNLLACTDGST